MFSSRWLPLASVFLALALVTGPSLALAQEKKAPSQRAALERAYSAWRTAMVTKNGGAWEKATAPSRKSAIKNLMISQRHAFPKALFAVPIRPPATLQLRCLDERVEGERAQLIYFGKVDMGVGSVDGDIPENLLILRFIRTGETWLFDSLKFASLAQSDEQRARLAAGNIIDLKGAEFDLPKNPPVVAKIVSYPDYVGHIQVSASGYRARIKVNGHDCGTVENSTTTNVVIGGFQKGRNDLDVEVEKLPVEDEEQRHFSISGYVFTGQKDKPRARVFHYLPEDMAAIPNRIRTDIWANAVTIQGR